MSTGLSLNRSSSRSRRPGQRTNDTKSKPHSAPVSSSDAEASLREVCLLGRPADPSNWNGRRWKVGARVVWLGRKYQVVASASPGQPSSGKAAYTHLSPV
jgi:hypothetical protein